VQRAVGHPRDHRRGHRNRLAQMQLARVQVNVQRFASRVDREAAILDAR